MGRLLGPSRAYFYRIALYIGHLFLSPSCPLVDLFAGEERDRDGDERPVLGRSEGSRVPHHQARVGRNLQLCPRNDRVSCRVLTCR